MIFFDFDGTLVDLWPRYYAVFTAITNAHYISEIEYKLAKQQLIKDSLVAKNFGINLPNDYFERKKLLLEEKEYLLLDKPFFSNITKLLREDSVILTKRRNPNNFYWQLEKLKIDCIAYVVEDKKKEIQKYKGEHLIIGDSVTDLELAALPNVKAWMVGYGLDTAERFLSTGITHRFFKDRVDLISALKNRNKFAI